MSDAPDIPESADKKLNRAIAVTVVILSVAMAITKIKDDNIVQAMQADQASKIDLWGEYQATRLKQHVLEATRPQLADPPAYDPRLVAREKQILKYGVEAADLKKQALAAQADYDAQGYRDDQFDLADGFASIALAVTAISALIESWGLLSVGWGAAAFGVLFSVAGFARLPVHPDWLVGFLT